jgi:hypothetical protein
VDQWGNVVINMDDSDELAEAIAALDAEAAKSAEQHKRNLGRLDSEDALIKWEAGMPKPERPRREPKLDTDLPALIETKIAAEREHYETKIAAEHERMMAIFAEAVALERADADAERARFEARIEHYVETATREANDRLEKVERTTDVVAKLGDAVHKQTDQLAGLVTKLDQQLSASENVGGLSPMQRYLRDLN